MVRITYAILTLFSIQAALELQAQGFSNQGLHLKKRYLQSEIWDSLEGISMYNKLAIGLGGDSVMRNALGYAEEGWVENHYVSGKLLHRGFYRNGQLLVSKNFFENGQCERSIEQIDPLRCTMELFYENGKQKKLLKYYEGKPYKKYEFYGNGMPKSAEENEKEMTYLISRKSWHRNGQMEQILELMDVKNKTYLQKLYYESGELMSEGTLVLREEKEYMKDGIWQYYDPEGRRKKIERYSADAPQASN
jgi:antitoxin component YwqK of YwqJK toxin-antitoxin module